ncbi:hypothetical protein [Garciella nitratireducens]|uniref:hypothetical protein n=1 Tax=Garciella nitratireducens TaxID=218205 RepID=UPI000DEA24E8|nr:hypothetical protein [Garciella nitratireducens]RBP41545.1 hypothetical protein DFR81_11015 [Garciella nitratireducens]
MEKIIIETNPSIQNLNLCFVRDQLHIFYCISEEKNGRVYKIQHHFKNGQDWKVEEVCSLMKGQILNPIEIFVKKDKIQLLYYHVVEGIEQLFIKTYDCKKEKWEGGQQLTNSNEKKLYLDVLHIKNELYITYCEYVQENLIVKYEKYLIEENYRKIREEEISNPANCQYPTFIYFNERLWLCWTEYDYVVSRYSEDEGIHWSELYLYKDSKREEILRYKYQTNKEENKILLNYAFGKADNLQFIGFGNLDNTDKIPLKEKSFKRACTQENFKVNTFNKEEFLNKQEKSLEELKKEIQKIEKRQKRIEGKMQEIQREFYSEQGKIENIEKIQEIQDRLMIIENFLLEHTRGFKYFRKK